MHDAVSTAVVVVVGYSSTHRENASIMTRMNVCPLASGLSGPMWSRCERVCLDLKMDAAHHLTTRALPYELGDHPISNRRVVEALACQTLPPMALAGIVNRGNLVIHLVASVEGQPRLLDCPANPLERALLACNSRISATRRQVPLDEPPFREHDISRSLYLGDKVSIVRSSRSA